MYSRFFKFIIIVCILMEDAQCWFGILGLFFLKQTTLAVGYTCTTDATAPDVRAAFAAERARGGWGGAWRGRSAQSATLCLCGSALPPRSSTHRLGAKLTDTLLCMWKQDIVFGFCFCCFFLKITCTATTYLNTKTTERRQRGKWLGEEKRVFRTRRGDRTFSGSSERLLSCK